MELPVELRSMIEDYAGGISRDALMRDARAISDTYRGARVNGGHVVATRSAAAAYAVARMPATYGAAYSALMAARQLVPDWHGVSVMDVGAGTGAAAWAAMGVFDVESVICLEREAAMRETGESFMRSSAFLALNEARWYEFDATGELRLSADIVMASYVLNELRPADRLPAVRRLWNASKKLLILIEPGTPEGYRQLMEERAELISLGAKIVAPCPHTAKCPLPEDDWCHFTCRVARTKLHKALKSGDAPYEDEKFMYIAAAREDIESDVRRVLRHPIIEPGRITVRLCGARGIEDKVIRKKDGEIFKRARKCGAGERL